MSSERLLGRKWAQRGAYLIVLCLASVAQLAATSSGDGWQELPAAPGTTIPGSKDRLASSVRRNFARRQLVRPKGRFTCIYATFCSGTPAIHRFCGMHAGIRHSNL